MRSRRLDAALAYSFDHRDDIDRRIADDQALARALRERTPSKLSDKLRSLHGERLSFEYRNRVCDTAAMGETLSIRVPAEEKARWEKAAAAVRESVAEYVRGAVRQRAQAASRSPWEPHFGSADVAVSAPTNANIRRAFARRRRHKG